MEMIFTSSWSTRERSSGTLYVHRELTGGQISTVPRIAKRSQVKDYKACTLYK
jgi:hypothetical protein